MLFPFYFLCPRNLENERKYSLMERLISTFNSFINRFCWSSLPFLFQIPGSLSFSILFLFIILHLETYS
eukprot:UN2362